MIHTFHELERLTNCHRLHLSRRWLGSGGIVNWIMLNPSTAGDFEDDPTIRKCVGFAKRWGYSGIDVTNLFTFRATDPSDLRALVKIDYARAVGLADGALIEKAKSASIVIAAWGINGTLAGRDKDVMNRVLQGTEFYCIGRTKNGHPLHPCMAGYTTAPLRFA